MQLKYSIHYMKDFGLCMEIIQHATTIPILGVCLGHQGIASFFGGQV
jgi:anthranilate/para-aminobenzoate synthase component II